MDSTENGVWCESYTQYILSEGSISYCSGHIIRNGKKVSCINTICYPLVINIPKKEDFLVVYAPFFLLNSFLIAFRVLQSRGNFCILVSAVMAFPQIILLEYNWHYSISGQLDELVNFCQKNIPLV